MMCGEDSDLISLDRGFLDQDGLCVTDNVGCRPGGIRGKDSGGGIKYKVPAFFVRRRGAKHTILFSHGNAEDLGMMYKRMKDLALVLCVNVMAYDYTGYGLSCVDEEDEKEWNELVEVDKSANGKKGGKDINKTLNVPSENMIYRNIEAAYVYLTQTRGIPPRNIILYGRSLGSGPSCYLAAKTALMGESVGGLILHSPFLSVYKVVADVGVDVRGDMFNNEKRAGNIR
jgi:pimeloyl-ACP methyl ester carboxylesterase